MIHTNCQMHNDDCDNYCLDSTLVLSRQYFSRYILTQLIGFLMPSQQQRSYQGDDYGLLTNSTSSSSGAFNNLINNHNFVFPQIRVNHGGIHRWLPLPLPIFSVKSKFCPSDSEIENVWLSLSLYQNHWSNSKRVINTAK